MLLPCKSPFRFSFRQSFCKIMIIPCMESSHIFRKFLHFKIVYIKIKSLNGLPALVLNLNTCTFFKRHCKIRSKTGTSFGSSSKRHRTIIIRFIPSLSEKRTNWRFYRWIIIAIPVHANNNIITT